ncbi:MAG: cupin domain-containing protein [Planctomycetes bacterium]|nr:cupin domain-containing protein [Planctomycetota bacterium]
MITADVNQIEGRRYPAGRRTRSFVGAGLAIEAKNFCMGMVDLDPQGGQVPWHNQEQEEIYLILEGVCEMCLGEERQRLEAGQSVYIPPGVFHQLTNIGGSPAKMLYFYSPAGDVAHWRQELSGTLPKAGVDVPALPEGSCPQYTEPKDD